MNLHLSIKHLLMTGIMLILSSNHAAHTMNVVTNANSAGPGSFPYELSRANNNSNPLKFTAGASGQICHLQGDVPLPAGLTNIVTIDTSGLAPSGGFTILGNTQGVFPIFSISNSGRRTGGTTFIGNGSITFIRSGVFDPGSNNMNNTFAGGTYNFDIDSGIVNQGPGT